MKKLLFLAAVVAGGVFVWRKVQEEKAQRELWTEVSDPV
ncbi:MULTISPECIES: DLW-39 family protein [unclassified Pseudactinotalea]|nr:MULTISPECIES: DLW-39 family protein [unclassified Pseudactinotalea]